ncbi:MAG TPA: pyruvate kinase [Nitriliruptorales bacterium]
MRRAKIVATLGPAVDDRDVLRETIAAGVDVVRLNFSHGTHADHERRLAMVTEIGDQLGKTVGSIGDLQGPKIRLGTLPANGLFLETGGETVLLGGREVLDDYMSDGVPVLPVVYEHLAKDVEPGSLVLIADGMLRLVVADVDGDAITCNVVAGGQATSRKGVNLPGVDVSAGSLTDKDRADLEAACRMGISWIALSFVRRPEDIVEARRMIHALDSTAPVIAKLERPEAVERINEILAVTDAVMVARGDLGVEMGPERVPALQKEIIDLANQEGRPVITATEMLESMVTHPRPTRAEASDVANAVFDGTDALMLSAETATGAHPIASVRTMANIILAAEEIPERIQAQRPARELSVSRLVARAAVQVAKDAKAKAILVFSFSGRSVQLVSKYRPPIPIIGLTTDEAPLRRFALMWGTHGELVGEEDHTADLVAAANEVCLSGGFAARGDRVVIVSGVPGGRGGTDRLLVHRIGDAVAG